MDHVKLRPGKTEHIAMNAESQVVCKRDSAPPEQQHNETENPASQQYPGEGFEEVVCLIWFRYGNVSWNRPLFDLEPAGFLEAQDLPRAFQPLDQVTQS